MTQEELDALMDGGLDEELETLEEETSLEEETLEEEVKEEVVEKEVAITEENYRVESSASWPPPPPTDDHKVVNQLDDVTKDSEEKAGEIFDKLEEINEFVVDIEEGGGTVILTLEKNIEMLEKLTVKFPNIETFSTSLSENKEAHQKLNLIVEKSQNSADEVMMIMDIMQYQDIHRQKIERVINVMRALSMYMSSLFESDVDDKNRVGSAVHITGDSDTNDLVDNDNIEALLESFVKK